MIFWPIIVKYCNTNIHMHIKQPENIFILFLFLGHLNTLDFHLRLSCVRFYVIYFRWVTYRCSELLSHYTSFFHFLHSRFIHTCTAVPKCNENYFTTKKPLPWTNIFYTCLIYPVLGKQLMFSQSPTCHFDCFLSFVPIWFFD